jgi:sulfite exporter TauE/SafE
MFHTDSLYLLMFASGLLGGFGHCVGMCGPIVATYSVCLEYRNIAPHLLYNLGRITTYGILGGLIGLTGSFAGLMSAIERFQSITLAFVGTIMIVVALSVGGWIPNRTRKGGGNPLSGAVSSAVKYVSCAKTVGAYFPMGLLLGFIPCGLLYTALIGAAGAGVAAKNHIEGFLHGMSLLLLFGIGTSPAMFFLGKIVSLKREWLRKRFHKGSAIMMIAMGILFLYRALG